MKKDSLLFIYCDESCHIEHDHEPNMVLGAIACPYKEVKKANAAIRALKQRHGLEHLEAKWQKVSPAKVNFYKELVTYFFDNEHLVFRGLVAPKGQLNHQAFQQTHETWYYKMYYYLLDALIHNQARFHIFLDIKDTCGSERRSKLKNVLHNANHDFNETLIQAIQAVRSEEVGLLQVADVLIGCIVAANREKAPESQAKQALIDLVKEKSTYSLLRSTPRGEKKFNVFHWCPQGRTWP